jgi:predicted HTH domain antitoxin
LTLILGMKKLTFSLPEEIDETEIKMAIASVLFDKGLFSSGQAADFVGISKRMFLETVGKYGVTIFGETEEDLRNE